MAVTDIASPFSNTPADGIVLHDSLSSIANVLFRPRTKPSLQRQKSSTVFSMLKRHWTAAIPTVFTILFGYYWLGGTAPNRSPQATMVFQLTKDADLFVDSKQIKLSRNVDSDISEVDVTPGEHQIQVKYNDGRIATKSVWVRDNERMEIKIELKKANEQVVATNRSKARRPLMR